MNQTVPSPLTTTSSGRVQRQPAPAVDHGLGHAGGAVDEADARRGRAGALLAHERPTIGVPSHAVAAWRRRAARRPRPTRRGRFDRPAARVQREVQSVLVGT